MDKTSMVIDFSTDGSVEAMNREEIMPLGFLGPQTITRASELKFDEATQLWGIWPMVNGVPSPPHRLASRFTTYNEARDVEVIWFERCRLYSVKPTTEVGYRLLDQLMLEAMLASVM